MAIEDSIKAILDADTTLTDLLTGGIWNRDLRRKGPGATAGAFAPEPPHQVRPSLVVLPEVFAADDVGPAASYFGQVALRIYAPAHQTGRDVIHSAINRLIVLLSEVWVADDGNGVELRIGSRDGVGDSAEIEGAITDVLTIRVAGLWRVH